MINITIDTENEAFSAENVEQELHRILTRLADQIRTDYGENMPIRDINGNTVGMVEYEGLTRPVK